MCTNQAYNALDGWMKAYFHMMGVASPADHVAGDGPHITFHNDIINLVPGSISSNREDTNDEHNSIISYDAHDFYESYMKEETTKKDIQNFIISKIDEHSKADSQWQTDQELNKGTEDYKITVKHRFDSSITMGETKVYPFEASKKLYKVIDNTGGNGWVKASCGGEEVFDYWDGKKENEFYLINNPEMEKIIYTSNFIKTVLEGLSAASGVDYKLLENKRLSQVTKLYHQYLSFSNETNSSYLTVFHAVGGLFDTVLMTPISYDSGLIVYGDYQRICEDEVIDVTNETTRVQYIFDNLDTSRKSYYGYAEYAYRSSDGYTNWYQPSQIDIFFSAMIIRADREFIDAFHPTLAIEIIKEENNKFKYKVVKQLSYTALKSEETTTWDVTLSTGTDINGREYCLSKSRNTLERVVTQLH